MAGGVRKDFYLGDGLFLLSVQTHRRIKAKTHQNVFLIWDGKRLLIVSLATLSFIFKNFLN